MHSAYLKGATAQLWICNICSNNFGRGAFSPSTVSLCHPVRETWIRQLYQNPAVSFILTPISRALAIGLCLYVKRAVAPKLSCHCIFFIKCLLAGALAFILIEAQKNTKCRRYEKSPSRPERDTAIFTACYDSCSDCAHNHEQSIKCKNSEHCHICYRTSSFYHVPFLKVCYKIVSKDTDIQIILSTIPKLYKAVSFANLGFDCRRHDRL